jgi:signal peptidase I
MERVRVGGKIKEKREGGILETVKVIVQALLIAVVVRTVLFQPFNIPSGSLVPTLLVGDYLFVSKYAYGYSRYSIPFGPPVFEGRIWGAEPQRGDIAVFKLPKDNATDYIKRVIGLPGDKVQMKEGLLYINNVAVERKPLPGFKDDEGQGKRWRETLPNGVTYETRDATDNGMLDNTRVFEVPSGHYFMMGDNRDNSMDSRTSQVGYVPFENLVGKAQIIFFSVRDGDAAWQFWLWPWSVRWDRLLTIVR